MEIATSMLKNVSGDENEDPIDVNYKKLKAEIQPIEKDDPEYIMIQEYIKNTRMYIYLIFF